MVPIKAKATPNRYAAIKTPTAGVSSTISPFLTLNRVVANSKNRAAITIKIAAMKLGRSVKRRKAISEKSILELSGLLDEGYLGARLVCRSGESGGSRRSPLVRPA